MNSTMAQRLRRRPAIDIGPQYPRILQILRFTPHDAKAGFAIGLQCPRVIERVRIERQHGGAAREAALDGPVEQPWAQATADIVRREPEEGDLFLGELEKSDDCAALPRDMKLMARATKQCPKGIIGKKATLVPEPWAADMVVEVSIEDDIR